MQYGDNFDGLKIVLICDSLFLLIVVEVIRVATQGVLKLEGIWEVHPDTILRLFIERWQVLNVEAWCLLSLFFNDIEVLIFNED